MDDLLLKTGNENNLISRIETLERIINDMVGNQIHGSRLDLISDDLGDMRAGRFLALTSGGEPTDADASGVFMSALGETFGSDTYNIGGVNNGAMQFGLNATTGKAAFAAGNAIIDLDGITGTNLLKWLIRQSATSGANVRTGKLGMQLAEGGTVPLFELSYYSDPGAELVTNGGAEAGALTAWTKTTETDCRWYVVDDHPRTGTYSFYPVVQSSTPFTGVLTSDRVAATALSSYLVGGYMYGSNLHVLPAAKIEINWYNHASAGSIIRTDLITDSLIGGAYSGNEKQIIAPATTLSAEIVLTCVGASANTDYAGANFDDISIKLISTNQKLQLTDAGLDTTNGMFPIAAEMWADQVITTVTVGNLFSASGPYCFYVGPSAANANNGDEYSFNFTIKAGTYTISTLGWTSTSSGKYDYYIDGVSVSTGQDWYGSVASAKKTIADIAISTSGNHVLKIKINGKHASSADYIAYITKIWIQ